LQGPGVIGGTGAELPIDTRPTLADAGISKKLSAQAQKMAALPPEAFEANSMSSIRILMPVSPGLSRVHARQLLLCRSAHPGEEGCRGAEATPRGSFWRFQSGTARNETLNVL
jgi:hypothetical protein